MAPRNFSSSPGPSFSNGNPFQYDIDPDWNRSNASPVDSPLYGPRPVPTANRISESSFPPTGYSTMIIDFRSYLRSVRTELKRMKYDVSRRPHPISREAHEEVLDRIEVMYENVGSTMRSLDHPTARHRFVIEVAATLKKEYYKLREDVEDVFFPLSLNANLSGSGERAGDGD